MKNIELQSRLIDFAVAARKLAQVLRFQYYRPSGRLTKRLTCAFANYGLLISLIIFVQYADQKGTLTEELLDLGWTITKRPKANFLPPDLEDLITTNNVLKTLIASGKYQKAEHKVAIPA